MNIKIHYYILIFIVILYLLGSVKTFLNFYFFAIIHEVAHMIIAKMLKVRITEIAFLPMGVNARFDENINYIKELVIAMAGPIASLLLAIFLRPPYNIMNLFIFATNMMPIYPLDGGRIARIIFIKIFKYKKGIKIYGIFTKTLMSFLIIASVTIAVYLKKYYFLIFNVYIYFLMNKEIKKQKIKSTIYEIVGVEI